MALDSDESISDAGLSGFIEAMVSSDLFKRDFYLKLTREFGPLSKSHANTWVNFDNSAYQKLLTPQQNEASMSNEELRQGLDFLVNKYVTAESLRVQLLAEVHQPDPNNIGVKGILHEIQSGLTEFDPADSKLLKDIAFNYV